MRKSNGRLPAKDWAETLDKRGAGQFLAAAEVFDNCVRAGRPPSGRAEKIIGSKAGLWELKVTKPGSSPPHLRLLYLREGNTLWAAIGVTKKSNKLKQKDVNAGDSVAADWKRGKE